MTSTCCAGPATTARYNVVVRADGLPLRVARRRRQAAHAGRRAASTRTRATLIRLERTDRAAQAAPSGTRRDVVDRRHASQYDSRAVRPLRRSRCVARAVSRRSRACGDDARVSPRAVRRRRSDGHADPLGAGPSEARAGTHPRRPICRRCRRGCHVARRRLRARERSRSRS